MFKTAKMDSSLSVRPVVIELRDGRRMTGTLHLPRTETAASLLGRAKPFFVVRTPTGDIAINSADIRALLLDEEARRAMPGRGNADREEPRRADATVVSPRRDAFKKPRKAPAGERRERRSSWKPVGAGGFDPCRILGVQPGASAEELKAAWRRRMAECHPDKVQGRGFGDDIVAAAQARAALVNQAYQSLMAMRRTG